MLSLFRKKKTAVSTCHKARSLARAIGQLEREKMYGGSYVAFVYEFKELVGRYEKGHVIVYQLPDGSTTPDQDAAVKIWSHTITVAELLDRPRDSQPRLEWERHGNGTDEACLRARLDRYAEGDDAAYDELTAACGHVWAHHTDWDVRRLVIR